VTIPPRPEGMDPALYARNAAANAQRLAMLRTRLAEVARGGPEKLRARHAKRGKLMARERIDRIVDPDTAFLELSSLAAWGQYGGEVPAAGIVTGIGIVHGVPVMFIAHDATVKGGSYYAETVRKHIRAQEIAETQRLPCVYLVDSGGANLPQQDRIFPGRDHFGKAFWRQCRMSAAGLPQIAAVFGGSTAGGAYIPALSDQVIMVQGNARIHLGGPSIVKVAVGEEADGETLGGAAMHTRVSGVSDLLAANEDEALALVRRLLAEANIARKPVTPAPVRPPVADPA
jgi:3-methylcrotonyl-CoA carboxylase beta subunit